MKVLVAMSGGVDSSVAAALLVEEGHDVVGVTLKQWQDDGGGAGCCTVGDAEDARRVAAQLDIPFYVLDYVDEFRTKVVEPFAEAYLAGATPNPCIECNRQVRFSALLDRTGALGCEQLATGHHARVGRDEDGFRLLRGADPGKDQSYVLHMLGQEALGRIRFPVGEMTKDAVREHAARLGLRTAGKPDSQDLCFLAHGDPRRLVRESHPGALRPGPIVDAAGRVVGRHDGAAGLTVGQRRGVGVSLGEPMFVLEVRPADDVVVIGPRNALLRDGCRVGGLQFVAGRPPAAGGVQVKLRYRSDPVACRLVVTEDGADIWFAEPQPAVAPGQAAVLYRGDEVVGGGTILTALDRLPAARR